MFRDFQLPENINFFSVATGIDFIIKTYKSK